MGPPTHATTVVGVTILTESPQGLSLASTKRRRAIPGMATAIATGFEPSAALRVALACGLYDFSLRLSERLRSCALAGNDGATVVVAESAPTCPECDG